MRARTRFWIGAVLAAAPLFGAAGVLAIAGSGNAAVGCPGASPDAGDYELSLPKSDIDVPRGSAIEIPVCVARAPGFDGEIRLRAELLPPGVDAAPLRVPPHGTSGLLRLAATRNAHPGAPQQSVLVAAAFGRVHTVAITVKVTGAHDTGASDPNEDEGRTAIAVLLSAP